MPLLQVKDFPAETYEQLRARSAQEHRSISQQTLHIVEQYLAAADGRAQASAATPSSEAASTAAHRATAYRSRYSNDPGDKTDYRAKRRATAERIRQRAPILAADDVPSTMELLRRSRKEDAR